MDQTESHLNEWNFLPDNDWGPMLTHRAIDRQRWFERIGGAEGAAFTAAALLGLQDAPIDAANYYSADIQGFGLFNEFGVPHKSFYAMKAFRVLCDMPDRLAIQGKAPAGTALAAGIDAANKQLIIVASHLTGERSHFRVRLSALPWSESSHCEASILDAAHDLTPTESRALNPREPDLENDLPANSVLLLKIQP